MMTENILPLFTAAVRRCQTAVRRRRLMLALLWPLLPSPAAPAVPMDDTLTRIAQSKTIRIGHRVDEPPFSYVVDGQPMGYSIDLCLRVVEGIKSYLRIDDIRVVYVPVSTATRFPMIRSRGIDLECAATTNNRERRKLAEFAYPHFVTATRFVALKSSGIRRLEQLAGRSVSASSGTINLEQLNAANSRLKLNISVVLKKINQDAFNLVASGKVSAFVMDDILLAGLIASAPNPDAFIISDDRLSRPEPYGILMPPGELTFRQAVNTQLRALFSGDDINAIYAKWFLSPIPPEGINLRYPMPPNLQAMLAQPTDYLD